MDYRLCAAPPAAVTHISHKKFLWHFYASFSLKGEAFGANSQLFQENEAGWIRDKASPLGEKLSSPGSSEPGDD